MVCSALRVVLRSVIPNFKLSVGERQLIAERLGVCTDGSGRAFHLCCDIEPFLIRAQPAVIEDYIVFVPERFIPFDNGDVQIDQVCPVVQDCDKAFTTKSTP
jgi:hypothetical protein